MSLVIGHIFRKLESFGDFGDFSECVLIFKVSLYFQVACVALHYSERERGKMKGER